MDTDSFCIEIFAMVKRQGVSGEQNSKGKMILTRVTITGADDKDDPADLAALSAKFPFLEWGILFSEGREGTPRYPSADWRQRLARVWDRQTSMQLALHACGRTARVAFDGGTSHLVRGSIFRRIQLNGFSESATDYLDQTLEGGLPRRFILQCKDQIALDRARAFALRHPNVDILFDASGGRGIAPQSWPAPVTPPGLMGYAGGLGPNGLEDTLNLLSRLSENGHFAIDMESGVRVADRLILGLVRDVLRKARNFC